MSHRISITALSPLSFAAQKPGTQFTPSLEYVPGSVLWGALGQLLQETPSVRFSHAFPASIGDRWVRLLPVTAARCKTNGGFRADSSDDRPAPHGTFDTLIDRVCAELLQPAALAYAPRCPSCLSQTKAASGYYARTQDGTYRARHAQRRMLTRVAIDRWRGTAAEELLYSPIVLSETNHVDGRDVQLQFLGQVWDADDSACAAIQEITAIGGRISSGLGRVEIRVTPNNQPQDLEDRVRRFNAAFRQRWQMFTQLAPQRQPDWSPDEFRVFSIGLQSDAILLEHGWQPTTTLSAEQLFAHTQLDAQPILTLATAHVVGGWNVSWNRPKPTALAAQAGAVYLFRTSAGEAALVKALEKLEQQGIGHRRLEGYGVVQCCDSFHVDALGEGV
jgi:CRISPR-associated protein Csx10